ncbi:MAG: dUTP diphosphatase [Clostridia bacterium]|nr:dUTP diphosphatase [Clostridia bacterium]
MDPKLSVKIRKLSTDAVLPRYGSADAAGADLCSIERVVVAPGETVLVHTGLAMELPCGYGGFIFARSGLATKRGLAPANKVGVIDADYRGEVLVALYNQSGVPQVVEQGERIAQLVLLPAPQAEFLEAESLNDTDRADGGFGSTGRK